MNRTVACLIASICLRTATAGEGKIPIFEPATITSPGKYVVTRDITASSGPAISIEADHVTVDLNGRSVGSDALGGAAGVITIAVGFSDVVVMGGRVLGVDGWGIYQANATSTARVEISGVQVTMSGSDGQGIYIGGAQAVVVDRSTVSVAGDAGIELHGVFDARIGNSRIALHDAGTSSAIVLDGAKGGMLTGNIVSISCGPSGGVGATGIALSGQGGTIIEGNTLSGGCYDAGAGIRLASDRNSVVGNTISDGFAKRTIHVLSNGNLVRDNVIVGGDSVSGLSVDGSDNTIQGNRILHACAGAGTAIDVSGQRNLIARNQVSKCGSNGIAVSGSLNIVEANTVTGMLRALVLSGSANSYRQNFLRGNTTPIEDTGTGNIDDGGNLR